MRTLAIGDIHGCATALAALLAELSPQPSDTLVLLGDYIDRGPNSREVVEQILALSERCALVPLLGNHEVMLLGAFQSRADEHFWRQCGGEETLASYGGDLKAIPQQHVEFFRGCRPYWETPTHLFLHANYDYDLALDEQTEDLLFWRHLSWGIPRPHISGKTVIVGHTPQPQGLPLDAGHVIAIDTHCYGGGWLTALDVAKRRYWQANERGETRQSDL